MAIIKSDGGKLVRKAGVLAHINAEPVEVDEAAERINIAEVKKADGMVVITNRHGWRAGQTLRGRTPGNVGETVVANIPFEVPLDAVDALVERLLALRDELLARG